MNTVRHQTLKSIFRSSTFGILFYTLLFVAPMVGGILTIAFTKSEQRKLNLLTQQLVSVIKPKIQIGDEIEIRGILSQMLQVSDASFISVSGGQIRPIVVSALTQDIESFEETNYFDVFLSPYIVQKSSFRMFPNHPEEFEVKVGFPNAIRTDVIRYTLLTTMAISVLLFIVLFMRLRNVLTYIRRPLESVSEYIERFDPAAQKAAALIEIEKLTETKGIKEKFDSLQQRLTQQQSALLSRSVEEERGKLANQVAHDLKSYTNILSQAIQNIRYRIGEDDLIVLQRAASNISIKMQQLQKVGSESLNEVERSFVFQLEAFVAHLVELKAIEYSHKKQLNIYFDFANSARGLFVKADPVELGTAISNLVNNSVEAIETSGTVVLSVKQEATLAAISIKDTGCGIPEHLLEEVKKHGFSTKNGTGRGKGLSQAFEAVQKDGGDLSIKSKVGEGTTIELSFIEQPPRRSFASNIGLNQVRRVFVIENDQNFASRVEQYLAKRNPDLEVAMFKDAQSFQGRAQTQEFSASDLFLVDYDLGDSQCTGVNLIENFQLSNQAFLLTHNYGNSHLLDECDKKEIRLLPKILFDKENLDIQENAIGEEYAGAVVDDDDLHIANLGRLAKERNIRLRFYNSFSQLKRNLATLNRDKIIVMDSRLDDGKKGEVLAKELYDNFGFKRIVLNSSYDEDHFRRLYPEGMYWIERVLQKDLNDVMLCFETAGPLGNARGQFNDTENIAGHGLQIPQAEVLT